MSCSKHFLVLHWKQHEWDRQVEDTSSVTMPVTDMWGRHFDGEQCVCRTRYVCRDCGTVVEEGECTCEPERGEQCAIRLRWLAQQEGASHEPLARRSNIDPAQRHSAH